MSDKSIYEVEVETEPIDIEPETKPTPLKKKRTVVMTPARLENLAKAREKARSVLKEKTSIKDARKNMKSEHMLLKRLELERDLANHNNYKKRLILEGNLAPPSTEIKPKQIRVKKPVVEDDDYNEPAIKELEEKLQALKASKTVKKIVKKPVVEESESELELETTAESEEEEEVIPIKKTKAKKIVKSNEILNPNKKIHDKKVELNSCDNDEINRRIRLLFPNF